MSDCDPIRRRRDAFLDGELPASEAEEARAHLAACARCRTEFERERAFLAAVAEAGRETAPPGLRRRVEAVLESGDWGPAPSGPGRRVWGLLAAAAVAALLLVARPWGGGVPQGPTGVAFAADHRAHAESAPSAIPFPPGSSPPPPPLAAVAERGLSRCVIDGRTYAHFTFRVSGATLSVFVPLDGAPPPDVRAREAGEPATVLAVEAGRGRPGAVLVADGIGEPALRRLWNRS